MGVSAARGLEPRVSEPRAPSSLMVPPPRKELPLCGEPAPCCPIAKLVPPIRTAVVEMMINLLARIFSSPSVGKCVTAGWVLLLSCKSTQGHAGFGPDLQAGRLAFA